MAVRSKLPWRLDATSTLGRSSEAREGDGATTHAAQRSLSERPTSLLGRSSAAREGCLRERSEATNLPTAGRSSKAREGDGGALLQGATNLLWEVERSEGGHSRFLLILMLFPFVSLQFFFLWEVERSEGGHLRFSLILMLFPFVSLPLSFPLLAASLPSPCL